MAHSGPPINPNRTRRYTLRQVCAVTGIGYHTFVYYRKVGLMPPPVEKGGSARYTWRHVHIAHQIVKRQRDRKQPLDGVAWEDFD